MRTLTLTINTVDVVHFTGDQLAPRSAAAPTHWSRYSVVEIRDGNEAPVEPADDEEDGCEDVELLHCLLPSVQHLSRDCTR